MNIRSFLLFSLLCITACKQETSISEISASQKTEDSQKVSEIYEADQADRMADDINWPKVTARDKARQKRVQQMIDSGLIKTATDYENAAMIFQHGDDSNSYKKAVDFMKKAIELDSMTNKWLFAASTDRYLQSIDKPQIYGTQYLQMGDEPWNMGKYDSLEISDETRKIYGVRTIAEQRQLLKKMNDNDNGHSH